MDVSLCIWVCLKCQERKKKILSKTFNLSFEKFFPAHRGGARMGRGWAVWGRGGGGLLLLNFRFTSFFPPLGEEREGGEGEQYEGGEEGGSWSCESCQERSALVAEMAEETKKLQQCWLQLRQVSLTILQWRGSEPTLFGSGSWFSCSFGSGSGIRAGSE